MFLEKAVFLPNSRAGNELGQILQLCQQVNTYSDEELRVKLHIMGARCPAELIYAVRLLLNGSMYLHQQLLASVVEPPLPIGDPSAPGTSLSQREQEVLALLAKGHTLPQIGRQLFISPATVNNHCARMREKLRLRGRNTLVVYASTLRN